MSTTSHSLSERYAVALLDAWAEIPEGQENVCLDRFIDILRADRMLPLVPTILTALEREVVERQARATTHIIVDRAPDTDLKHLFTRFAPYAVKEDSGLIGGVIVRRADRLIDGSVRGQLDTIRQALVAA